MKKVLVMSMVFAFLVGCASLEERSNDNRYSQFFNGFEGKGKVFIVPVTENYTKFKGGGEIVHSEIGRQLKDNGWSVATMSMENHNVLWAKTISDVGGIYSPINGELLTNKYKSALLKFIEAINETDSFAAVVFPSLLLKPAELKGKNAHWDGA